MNKFASKVLALGLITSIALTSFTGCFGHGGKNKIADDTPWFNMTTYEVSPNVNKAEFQNIYTDIVGSTDDYLVFHSNGFYNVSSDFEYTMSNIWGNTYAALDIYDYSLNLVESIDLKSELSGLNMEGFWDFDEIEKEGDDFVVRAQLWDEDLSSSIVYCSVLDMETLTLSAFVPDEGNAAREALTSSKPGGIFSDVHHIGDYTVEPYWDFSSGSVEYFLLITDSQGNYDILSINETLPTADINNISLIFAISDTQGVMVTQTSAYDGNHYYILDAVNGTITPYEEDMSWINNSVGNIKYVDDYGYVVVNQDGVFSIDFNNSELTPMMEFNNSNANRFNCNGLTPIKITDERVILIGFSNEPHVVYDNTVTNVFVFERAESNPHAGKTILTLASLSSLNYSICDAICRFNESNPDYYIEVDSRYDISNFQDNTIEDATVGKEKAAQELGNQLSIDLISGVGPDIIIDGASYSQLDNEDYLVNLNDYVSGLDSNTYFTNIIESAKNGDEIYQLPVTFSVTGIATNASYVNDGQVGFTYDEYVDFVNDCCNGRDPVDEATQIDYFIRCLSLMPDYMYADDTVSYSNDAFTALAEYVRDHVNNKIDGEEDYYEYDTNVVQIRDMSQYISSIVLPVTQKTFVGLPTYDGRGPVISPRNSVAVAANLSDGEQAACFEYINMLLDDSTQYLLAIESGIPINRNVFNTIGQEYVDSNNANIAWLTENMTDAQIRAEGINPNPVEYSSVAVFEELISSASSWVTTDGAVNAIIREEMPAFFAGDKTLEQVVATLENRVHTLINERG